MFFQVLFEKTCSMKFSKRLEDRWIFVVGMNNKRKRKKEKGKEMEKNCKQKEMKEEREGKMPNPYRLSHFVAPLYVAPSPTPGNAKPTSEFFWHGRLI